ncbi:hypothetical protein B0O99DRAFT_601631 [Bisporella sp. PMI_857]|nr:hypothetical protein B0O99DRAFT_601631 [Bisporella sp. PMI_857]
MPRDRKSNSEMLRLSNSDTSSLAGSPQANVIDTNNPQEAASLSIRRMEDGLTVGRNDLWAEEAVEELAPAIKEQLLKKLAAVYGEIAVHNVEIMSAEAGDGENGGDEEFDFQMFSGGAQKIVLFQDEGVGGGGFVELRDPRIFVVPPAEGERKAAFELMAVDGEAVLHAARKRAWGLEVPWRVRTIKITASRKCREDAGKNPSATDSQNGKKKKPGKRQRIILRQRTKKIAELETRLKLENQRKEEAERDKKARRNREKKLKKRMKEKASKAAARAQESNIPEFAVLASPN